MTPKPHRRNGDKLWVKIIKIVSLAVIVTVFAFTNFSTFKYVDAENQEQDKLWEERQKTIDQKLDFLVQNVGKSNEDIRENRKRLEEEIKRDRDRREP